MDEDIDELRELVRKNIAVTEDTNKLVHRMHRSALWGRFFQIVWWLAVLAASGAAYYYYLQPYVQQLENLYGQVEKSGQQYPNWQTELQALLGNVSSHTATTTQQ